jgi:adenosylcobyric acid synthase
MNARTLMVQGTGSSVGKSLLVTGLCRLYSRRGLRVAPFKAQNMSNNAGVTPDGGEIGRAQVSQAEACGLLPSADMNPILLKPEADHRSQVVLLGKAWATLQAGAYYQCKSELWTQVTGALDRLRAAYDLVIIEGAGSPAELNLREGDIVNMPVAQYAGSPVLLAGDIDKGGIFAQLLGTLWLMQAEEKALVKGFIVNKFRGDPALFVDGVRILEQRGGVPVIGVVPWVHDHGVAQEDAAVLDYEASPWDGAQSSVPPDRPGSVVDIAVVALPRIANFDDFDPLIAEPGVRVRWVRDAEALGQPEAVILPGTKHTQADLAWLRAKGLADSIVELAARGRAIVGICGGYQMLSRAISDPEGVEGMGGESSALGLLDADVLFASEKTTWEAQAQLAGALPWLDDAGEMVGYEIHAGQAHAARPLLKIRRANGQELMDGARSADGRIWGTHLHGLFRNDAFRRAWLASLGWRPAPGQDARPARRGPAAYDHLADVLEANLDMARLDRIIRQL